MIPVSQPERGTRPWPTIAALAVIWVFTLANQIWTFAVLFIAWALYDIATGESNFIERITRTRPPGHLLARGGQLVDDVGPLAALARLTGRCRKIRAWPGDGPVRGVPRPVLAAGIRHRLG